MLRQQGQNALMAIVVTVAFLLKLDQSALRSLDSVTQPEFNSWPCSVILGKVFKLFWASLISSV